MAAEGDQDERERASRSWAALWNGNIMQSGRQMHACRITSTLLFVSRYGRQTERGTERSISTLLANRVLGFAHRDIFFLSCCTDPFISCTFVPRFLSPCYPLFFSDFPSRLCACLVHCHYSALSLAEQCWSCFPHEIVASVLLILLIPPSAPLFEPPFFKDFFSQLVHVCKNRGMRKWMRSRLLRRPTPDKQKRIVVEKMLATFPENSLSLYPQILPTDQMHRGESNGIFLSMKTPPTLSVFVQVAGSTKWVMDRDDWN